MLKSRIPEIIVELDPTVVAAEHAGAELVVRSAQARVPYVSGDLYRAIHTEPDPDTGGVLVLAGDDKVFYGRFVEHGHNGGAVAPRPFLIPALEENRARITELIDAAVRRVVQ